MTTTKDSLTALARVHPERAPSGAAHAGAVPRPPARWQTRVALPGVILASTTALVLFAARDALRPATPVRIAPVVLRTPSAPAPDDAAAPNAESGADADTDAPTPAPVAAFGRTVQAAGWIEADPYATSASALTSGVVEQILVLEGERVEAGQVVARLVREDAELTLRQVEAMVAQREADLVSAIADRDAAQRDWDHPVERTRAVKTAEARLAELRAELERLPALIAIEAATLRQYEEELQRAEAAHAANAIGEIELIRLQQRTAAQQATHDAIVKRQAVLEAQIDQQQADLEAARENLRLRIEERRELDAAKARVQRAHALLADAKAKRDEAALRLERVEVVAPRAGVVMSRLKEPGDKVMLSGDDPHSATVVRLFDPQHLQVRVDVPLADAAAVGVGQRATVVVEVLPDHEFSGVVTRVTGEADLQKNTLQVKVAIDDPLPVLRPEMLARVKFHPGTATADATASTTGASAPAPSSDMSGLVLLAPDEALHRDPADPAAAEVVVVMDRRHGHGTAQRRTVTLGAPHGDDGWVVVREGLHAGDLLVLAPDDGIEDGDRLRIITQQLAGAQR